MSDFTLTDKIKKEEQMGRKKAIKEHLKSTIPYLIKDEFESYKDEILSRVARKVTEDLKENIDDTMSTDELKQYITEELDGLFIDFHSPAESANRRYLVETQRGKFLRERREEERNQ